MEKSEEEDNGILYCNHCDDMVTRSTYLRHERKRTMIASLANFTHTETDSDSDGSSTDAEDALTIQSQGSANTSFSQPEHDLEINEKGESSSSQTEDDESENSCTSSEEDEYDIDGNEEEVWNGVLPEYLIKDIESAPPIPEVEPKEGKLKKINSLIFWFVYFLLIWQATCHISDNGMAWLLKFLTTWLKIIGIEISSDIMAKLVTLFPGSLYLMRQFIDLDRDAFNKFVVCPKCTKLYNYESCVTLVNNRQVAKTCSHFHYSRGKKKVCGSPLVTKVHFKEGKSLFYPIKYYCSNSIATELEKLVQRKNIPQSCESWRNRNVGQDFLADIYDGELWKEFQIVSGKDFLKSPRNYGFMLNFDFFQPMKHRKDYSVGVFYLALLNLPREQRFKWENIIVIGTVPSCDKEPNNLNEFLQPAIDELKALWKGVKLKNSLSRFPLTFRAAVMSTSSDVPATRKLCGFKGHSAIFGCSRCLKEFPGEFGEKRDYSGFIRSLWKPRTNKDHRKAAEKMKKCKTKSEKAKLGKMSGIAHYSILLQLQYVDIIRFATIDPMHNLFLGTAKKIFQLWVDEKVLSKKQLTEIENRIEDFEVPADIGRLPKKISSNSGSYTAEQWKNWTLIYSVFCLKNVLPDQHFKCWQTFVLSCKYLCQPVISRTQIEIGDRLMVKFCNMFEKIYGKEAVTPNMHLHCHLKDVILDHGPVAGFWCFSFERFNGIMGSVNTNNRSVELQLMRRLMISRFLDESTLPYDFQNDFLKLCTEKDKAGNEDEGKQDYHKIFHLQNIACAHPITNINWNLIDGIKLPSTYRISHCDSDDLKMLLEVYKLIFPSLNIQLSNLSECLQKYGSINIGPTRYGSRLEPRGIRSSNILASWPSGTDGLINKDTYSLTPGSVNFFFSHSLKLGDNYQTYYFACVRWYAPSPQPESIGNPVQIWNGNFQDAGPASFMPVQRIHSRFGFAKMKDNREMKDNNRAFKC